MTRTPDENLRLFAGSAVFAVAVISFTRLPLLPEIGDDLDLSVTELGLLMSAFGVGRLVADLPAGRVTGQRAPLGLMAWSAACLALGVGALGGSPGLAVAITASFTIGIASSVAYTAGMHVFASIPSKGERGRSMAAFSSLQMTGQMLGPAAGGAVAVFAGWRVGLEAAAAIAAAFALLLWLKSRRRSAQAALSHSDAGASFGGVDGNLIARRSNAEFIALSLVPFTVFFTVGGVLQTLIPIVGAERLGLNPLAIGATLALAAGLRIGSVLATGWIADRVSRAAALTPLLFALGISLSFLALPVTVFTWAGVAVLIAVCTANVGTAAAMIGDYSSGSELGTLLGQFRFAGDIGLVAGPAVVTLLYGQHGLAATGATLAVAVLGCAVVVTFLVKEKGPDPELG